MFHRPIPHMRPDPTAQEISEARFKRFMKDLDTYERKFIFERTLDAFLDLYSDWKKSHGQDVKLRLVMLGFELHRLNPEFQFDLFFPDESVRTHGAQTTVIPDPF